MNFRQRNIDYSVICKSTRVKTYLVLRAMASNNTAAAYYVKYDCTSYSYITNIVYINTQIVNFVGIKIHQKIPILLFTQNVPHNV